MPQKTPLYEMRRQFRDMRYDRGSFSWELEKRVSVLAASFRKARLLAGLSNRSGKEDQLMILLLVKFAHALCGRLTVLILWRRKGHR